MRKLGPGTYVVAVPELHPKVMASHGRLWVLRPCPSLNTASADRVRHANQVTLEYQRQ